MRNLPIVDRQVVPCSLLGSCGAATVEAHVLYFVSEDQLCRLDVHPTRKGEVEVLAPLDCGLVIDVKYLPEEDVLVLVSASGSVVVYHFTSSEIETVGDVAGGIAGCGWSPDMETLVLVTGAGNLLLMTRSWDVLSEINLFQEGAGDGEFVSVGWGSKETQFHGSEGKDSRTKKEVQGRLADWDDRAPRTVWRADGLYFAVNAVNPSLGYRSIQVFNRDGRLQNVSETVAQLEQSLSWKSSGASGLLTGTVSLAEQRKQHVAFFEKNGLRHGEFEIALGSKVLDSYWNSDSTILALLVQSGAGECGVQLWTTSNYHWSAKRFLTFPDGGRPLWISWDPIDAYRLHLISSAGEYVRNDYQSVIDSSRGSSSSDQACVAVIDGRSVRLTLLREAVVPPPMCAWEVHLADVVDSVAFQHGHSARFGVVSRGSRIDCFEVTTAIVEASEGGTIANDVTIIRRQGRTQRPVQIATYKMAPNLESDYYHWQWINDTLMVACSMNQLVLLDLKDATASIKKSFDFDARVGALAPWRAEDAVVVQLIDGRLFCLRLASLELAERGAWAEFCPQLDLIDDRVVGLAASGRLYCDGRQLLDAISSFVVRGDFLMATSVQNHQLVCMAAESLLASDPPAASQRRIERGAKLIGAVAAGTMVVLQMPRGNLEAIHPRALTLNLLKHLINGLAYADAFDLMKRQRINLNLLFDHDPEPWLQNCAAFIDQIGGKGVANLNLFLSEVQQEDFTATMYQDSYRGRPETPYENKVDTICTRMRTIMEEADRVRYLLPILTSFVRQGRIDSALKAVQGVDSESTKDDALKYLAVLVDGAKLYTEALATYDLQLTLMVVQRSQMDPKEYLPFLNELNAMEDVHLRRFSIDSSLKRHDAAVVHLCRCRPVRTAEIVAFMKLHKSYAPVVDHFCSDGGASAGEDGVAEVLEAAARLQADVLVSRSLHEDAGYVLQRVGLHRPALELFQQAALWNQCLSLAALLDFQEPETRTLIGGLAKSLRATRRYRDAAHLCEWHLGDFHQSLECLIEGSLFPDAWALTLRHSMTEQRETLLKNSLVEALQMMEERLQQLRTECTTYTSRLAIVRQNLLHKLENPPSATDHSDLFSETGSSVFTGSGTSASDRTGRSSKNRRKLERKKLQLKEGTAFEDLAIVHHLHQLHSSVNNILDDVGSLLRGGLLILKDWQPLRRLQSQCESLVHFMEAQKKEVWNFNALHQQPDADRTYGPSSTTETIISQLQKEKTDFFATRYLELDPKIRSAPEISASDWKLQVLK